MLKESTAVPSESLPLVRIPEGEIDWIFPEAAHHACSFHVSMGEDVNLKSL